MKKVRGLTFIEVLIAIVIVAIILSTMLTGMNFGIRYSRHNANKTMALNFAQGLMEEIKATKYEDLETRYNGYVDNTKSLYQKEDALIPLILTVELGDEEEGTEYRTVKVIASWIWQGIEKDEELNTIRANY